MSDPAPIVTAAVMRAAENRAIAGGVSVNALMERAGAAVAEAAWRFGGGRSVLILCGPGNNGGDGYVAARVLGANGANVRVAAAADPRTPAAMAARAAWGGPVESLEKAWPASVLVDALFGTGLSRALDDTIAWPLARLVTAAHWSMAVDVPSGLGSDDGALLAPAPHFCMTLALGALKPVHRLQPAADHCGIVRVAGIGIPIESQWQTLAAPMLRVPGAEDHKYTRGLVAVVAGAMPGAARLSAIAAMRAGAGYVRLHGASGGPDALVPRPIEALDDNRIGAVLIGPGLGRDEEAVRRLDLACAGERPLVLDADALALLTPEGIAAFGGMPILTPHGGEFTALFGTGQGSKIDRTLAAAAQSGAVIVHKGADSVVAAPDGRVAIATDASPWLSTAGTGDVLAGIIAAMRARGLEPFEAACAGLWLQGEAARIAGPAFIADDLASHLPAAIAASL